MAAAAGAAPALTGQQQQQAALFASKHAELLSEARAVARAHGVNVLTVAFLPGGAGAVAHELVGGVAREERMRGMIGRTVARDVSAMGTREVAAHHRELLALRAIVLRELQSKKEQVAAAAKDGDAGGKTKRAMEQHETDGSGSNKSRRTESRNTSVHCMVIDRSSLPAPSSSSALSW